LVKQFVQTQCVSVQYVNRQLYLKALLVDLKGLTARFFFLLFSVLTRILTNAYFLFFKDQKHGIINKKEGRHTCQGEI